MTKVPAVPFSVARHAEQGRGPAVGIGTKEGTRGEVVTLCAIGVAHIAARLILARNQRQVGDGFDVAQSLFFRNIQARVCADFPANVARPGTMHGTGRLLASRQGMIRVAEAAGAGHVDGRRVRHGRCGLSRPTDFD